VTFLVIVLWIVEVALRITNAEITVQYTNCDTDGRVLKGPYENFRLQEIFLKENCKNTEISVFDTSEMF